MFCRHWPGRSAAQHRCSFRCRCRHINGQGSKCCSCCPVPWRAPLWKWYPGFPIQPYGSAEPMVVTIPSPPWPGWSLHRHHLPASGILARTLAFAISWITVFGYRCHRGDRSPWGSHSSARVPVHHGQPGQWRLALKSRGILAFVRTHQRIDHPLMMLPPPAGGPPAGSREMASPALCAVNYIFYDGGRFTLLQGMMISCRG